MRRGSPGSIYTPHTKSPSIWRGIYSDGLNCRSHSNSEQTLYPIRNTATGNEPLPADRDYACQAFRAWADYAFVDGYTISDTTLAAVFAEAGLTMDWTTPERGVSLPEKAREIIHANLAIDERPEIETEGT